MKSMKHIQYKNISLYFAPEPPLFGLLPQPSPVCSVNSVSPWMAVHRLSEGGHDTWRFQIDIFQYHPQNMKSWLLNHFLNSSLNEQEHLCRLLYDDWGRLLANPVQLLSETSVFCRQGWLDLFLSVVSFTCAAWRDVPTNCFFFNTLFPHLTDSTYLFAFSPPAFCHHSVYSPLRVCYLTLSPSSQWPKKLGWHDYTGYS